MADNQPKAPTPDKSVTQQTQDRVAGYADFVSPDVSAASNGLRNQLEKGAQARLKLG